MEIKIVRYEHNIVRIDAVGKISRDGWAINREPLAELFGEDIYRHVVVLSLANSDYLDSTGVEWLLTAHKRCLRAGGKLVIHSAKPMMQQILKMMRMDLVLNLAPDEERAREMMQGVLNEQSP
jgi:anti-anti-sigma factor